MLRVLRTPCHRRDTASKLAPACQLTGNLPAATFPQLLRAPPFLAAWECALDDLHDAERQALAARQSRNVPAFYLALKQVDEARERTAILLAAAVAKKRAFGG